MLDRIYLDDGQIILNADLANTSDIDEYLKGIGCEKPEELYRLGNQIYILDSEAWKDRYVPFFIDLDSLWYSLRTKPEEPEHYFVVGIDQQEMDSLRRRMKFYFSLRSILKGLCHHEGDDTQPMKYVFFSSKESHLTKLEIPFAMSREEFLSIELDNVSVSKAETLKTAVQQEDDVHCDERKHVMREALIEFFKEGDNRNLAFLMSGIKKFYQAYTERYKVYISKFSVNKILSEIESERIGFLCKIQDAIMSQQTKAFAVPGGLVAVGAVLRLYSNPWDFFIIFIGFFITIWMVASLNRNVINHIDLLDDEFKKSLAKYDDVVVGVEEVKAEIDRSRSKLYLSSKEAKGKLSALSRISWMILILVSLMLIGRSGLVTADNIGNSFDIVIRNLHKIIHT